MRRLYTVLISLIASIGAIHADVDGAFIFVNADGEEIADGTTLTNSELVADAEWDEISSGLYIKNTLSSVCWVEIVYEITVIDNGTHQICTQTVCNTDTEIGSYEYPSIVTIKAGATQDMLTEWYPSDYGQCTVTYTLKRKSYDGKDSSGNYVYSDVADCASVTVNYVYSDPTGINSVTTTANKIVSTQYYTLTGKRVTTPSKGLYIVKVTYTDGTVKTLKQTK